jgi:hypothetical protein
MLQSRHSYAQLVQGAVRVNQHLRIPLDPLVKLFIRSWCILNVNLVRHNETWLRPTRYNHVAKISVVGLDIALSGSEVQALHGSVLENNCGAPTYLFEKLSE